MGGRNWLLAGVGLVMLAAGIAVYVLTQRATQPLDTAAVIPADAVYVVRVDGAGAWLDQARGKEWWTDAKRFIESSVAEDSVSAFQEAVDELSEQIGNELDLDDARRLLGQEVTAAALPSPDGGVDWIVVSRVDVAGLASDLLSGGTDWRELRDELFRRVELAEFSIETREVGENVSAIATRQGTSVHILMMDDLLIVASAARDIDGAVALAAEGGTGSLAESQRFTEELARLPDDATAVDYIDLELLQMHADAFAEAVEMDDREQLDMLLEPIAAPAVARALRLPDGDLYRATWDYSRTFAEIFEDGASPPLTSALMRGAHGAVVVTDVGGALEAARSSGGWKHMAESWAVEKLSELALEEMADDGPESPQDVAEASRFPMRLAAHAVGEHMTKLLAGEFAAAGSLNASQPDESEFVFVARLGIDGALLYHLGLLVDDADMEVQRLSHRTFLSSEPVTMCRVGDVLVIASDLQVADAAAARLVAGEPVTPGVLEGTRDDMRLRMGMDIAGLTSQFDEMDGAPPELDDLGWMYGGHVSRITLDGDVDDAFTTLRVGVGMHYPADDVESVHAFFGSEEQAVLPMLRTIPDGAIIARAQLLDLSAMVGQFRDTLPIEPDDWAEGMSAASEALGVEVEGRLLPAFGPTIAWSLLPARRQGDGQPPIPGVVVAFDVREHDPVEKAVSGLFELMEKSAQEDSSMDGARFWNVDTDVGSVRRMEFGREMGVPPSIAPVMGWIDGRLVLASHMSHWDRFADVSRGRVADCTTGATFDEIRATELEVGGLGTGYMDWDLLLDQVAEYAPEIGSMLPNAVDFPEWNENMTDEAWQKAIADYEAAVKASSSGREEEVTKGIDSFRVMRIMASTDTASPDGLHADMVITLIR